MCLPPTGREKIVYPTLRRFHISFRPISRITAGFVGLALALGYCAGIQGCKFTPCFFSI